MGAALVWRGRLGGGRVDLGAIDTSRELVDDFHLMVGERGGEGTRSLEGEPKEDDERGDGDPVRKGSRVRAGVALMPG